MCASPTVQRMYFTGDRCCVVRGRLGAAAPAKPPGLLWQLLPFPSRSCKTTTQRQASDGRGRAVVAGNSLGSRTELAEMDARTPARVSARIRRDASGPRKNFPRGKGSLNRGASSAGHETVLAKHWGERDGRLNNGPSRTSHEMREGYCLDIVRKWVDTSLGLPPGAGRAQPAEAGKFLLQRRRGVSPSVIPKSRHCSAC